MKNGLLIIVILLAGCSEKFTFCKCKKINQRSFNFSYEVEIEPTDGKKLEMWIPVPMSNEVQSISNLRYDTDELPFQLFDEQNHGNKYLYIYNKNGTLESKHITLAFDVSRHEHQNEHYSNVDPEKYLESYQNVPTGYIFDEIITENQLSKDNMRAVYNFVLAGMHYGKPKSIDDKYYKSPWLSADSVYGKKEVTRDEVVTLYQHADKDGGDYTFGNGNSIYACDIGVGNCTDYHSYFMSLGRTLEIPVRFHMGFPIPSEPEGIVGGYHCWADFYIDGEGWYPVDISEADKQPEKSDYYFGTVCNNRVEMIVGRDFKLEGYENEIANLFIYPIMEVEDVKSTDFSKKFSYKNI